jgi:RNA polymerase primary sigma factor
MKQLIITKRLTDRSDGSFDQYLQEIKRIPMISVDQEIALAFKIKEGDEEALHKLVSSNLRFVISVAKQYQAGNVSLSDLVCEGNIGLIKAAKKFDHTRGFKFISYAVWWIRQSILQYLTDKKRTIRLPNNLSGLNNKISKSRIHLSQKLEREPTIDELSEDIDIPSDTIESLLKYINNPVSLDENWKDEDRNFHDVLESKSYVLFEKKLTIDSAKVDIKRLLKKIPEREKIVICYYFGLDGFEKLSLIEIANRLNLSTEGVRQIRERGLRRLRKPRVKSQLKEYCI